LKGLKIDRLSLKRVMSS